LLAWVGLYGAIKGGQYEAFIESEGTFPDLFARAFGFGIKAVTIAGEGELTEPEVLATAGIGPHNSLLFLDAASVRARLKDLALVKDVSVTKLYPNRLLIEFEERQPNALWQKDGRVKIISADGTALEELRDARFANLPLVVGPAANQKLAEYLRLLDSVGEIRGKIRAGMLIAERRWTLKTTGNVDIDLPEINPEAALATLLQLQRDFRILDKDIIALDLRQPGRVVVRVSDEAARAQAEAVARKVKGKGGPT
jgi:cell division protein FtsQ